MPIAFVNNADSGAEAAGTSISTGSLSVSAGNLLVAFVRGDVSATYTVSDSAANTWHSAGVQVTGSIISQVFYSFVTNASSTDVVSVSFSATQNYGVVTVGQWSKTLANWNIDGSAAGTSGTGTTLTSPSFTSSSAAELILGLGTSFGGLTYAAGTIGGVAAGGSFVNGTNGSSTDSMVEYLVASSIQSAITATITTSTSEPWDMHIVGFYESGAGGAGPLPPLLDPHRSGRHEPHMLANW